MTRRAGFTLVELLIVVAVIAIIAAIAIPNFMSSRIRANESAAIATLKQIAVAQAQVKASVAIDADGDGVGEYGYFQELTGLRNVRTGVPPAVAVGTVRVTPPTLSGAFADLEDIGPYNIALRSGYYFVICLPSEAAGWLPERSTSIVYGPVSPDLSESIWTCHAWPVSYGRSGQRIFFVNQAGEVLSASNSVSKYGGLDNAINVPGILLKTTPVNVLMTDTIAINGTGNDGNYWTVVN